ncbi:MAG TPA: methyltransferase domain-containing protein [Flavobacteriales bacterium]|nr:methyltransferase domain-containing protein [Flavobacteriales bacterium]
MGWYTHWFGTRYYTLLYGHRDEADAAEWVSGIVDRWRLPSGAAILDLACGRGRHCKQFADRGYRVTGVDLSAESIADARILVPEADLHVLDMREPAGVECFDGVCCLFTSLGYFERKEDDQRVFDAVARALKPGGVFVLDFMNVDVALRDLVASEELEHKGVHFRIQRRLVGDVLCKRITVRDGQEEHRYEERVQALRYEELERMAVQAGLEVLDRTDGPVLSTFDPMTSARFVLWMRKP